jgi:MFS transporter, DHA3 family, macrolide efflux protein
MRLTGMRAFGLLWLSHAVSLIGSGLTAFALGVHVYQVTGSVSRFAIIEFLSLAPVALLSPVAGALTDRWDRRRTLIIADVLAALAPLVLAWCMRDGHTSLWHIGVTAATISTLSAFQWPAFATLTTQLVPHQNLGRAAGATEMARAVAQIFSPILAGVAMSSASIGMLLLIDSATYLFSVSMMLILLRAPLAKTSTPLERGAVTLLHDIRRGWRYLATRRDLLVLSGFFAFTNLSLGIVEICITPLVLSFASPAALGGVLWIGGIGMLLGGLLMSVWRGAGQPMRLVLAVTLVQGALLIAAGASRSLVSMTVVAFLYLFCFPISMATNHAMWLRAVPVAMQGSVLGLRRAMEGAALPVAALVAGPLVDGIFEPLLTAHGPLGSALAGVLGAGPGRGIALMYVALGLLTILVSAVALSRAGHLLPVEASALGEGQT